MNCCNAYGHCTQGADRAARTAMLANCVPQANPTWPPPERTRDDTSDRAIANAGSVWFVDSPLSPPEELANNPVPPEAGNTRILDDADDWHPLTPIDEIKLYSFVGVFLLAWIALIAAFSGYSWKAWGPSLMAYLSAALLP